MVETTRRTEYFQVEVEEEAGVARCRRGRGVIRRQFYHAHDLVGCLLRHATLGRELPEQRRALRLIVVSSQELRRRREK